MKTGQKVGSKAGNNREKKPRGPGKKFKPNDPVTGERDERINRNGANRKFADLRAMTLAVLHEELELKKGEAVIGKMPFVENIIRQWLLSGDFSKQNRAIEIGYGKVPDELHHTYDEDEFIRRHINKFTDGELQRIQAGENGLDILLSKLETQLAENKKK